MSSLKALTGGVVEDPVAAFAVVLFSMVDLSRSWFFGLFVLPMVLRTCFVANLREFLTLEGTE